MSDVISLDDLKERRLDNDPHFNVWALCIECTHRWIGTVHFMTSLFTLECPQCKECNSFAAVIPEEYLRARKVDDESIVDSLK